LNFNNIADNRFFIYLQKIINTFFYSMKNRYIALLRGINVGGNNMIKMTDLKACFEKMGFDGVVTYIQSGNVLFDFNTEDPEQLTVDIEQRLSEQFLYTSRIVLLPQQHIRRIITNAPAGFGCQPDEYRYDVLFLKAPLTAPEALKLIRIRDGVDVVTAGDSVIYFSRLISKAGQSYMTKMIGTPVYKQLTIRNWNTTRKLADL